MGTLLCFLRYLVSHMKLLKLPMSQFLFQQQLPFAVVGSREEVVINGEKCRARQYPWGTVVGKCCKPLSK